ncbi:MAG: D-alanyl-D-alanine carboxypeptidase [Clostridia bacterium]|nr:D-alanyl-D-alanine carboxypeptidase [Clostridia bacterium]
MKSCVHGKRGVCLLLAIAAVVLNISASGDDGAGGLPSKSENALAVSQEITGAPPDISAASAVVTDLFGKVLYEKNADERRPMASTTKIMTALTVMENAADLNATVTVPAAAVGIEGSSVYLYEGEKLTVLQLLYAMMLESANDAAAALAISMAENVDSFAQMMNTTAAAMGLTDTNFVNPHGLYHDDHYTTAYELAQITARAMTYPGFREIVSANKMKIPLNGGEGERLLINHNKLLKRYEGCIGVKTGYTKRSGRCLVSAAERDGMTLICVTLCAPDDWQDHSALLDWAFSKYESTVLSEAGEEHITLPVVGSGEADGGVAPVTPLCTSEAFRVTLERNVQHIYTVVEAPRFLYAPVRAGDAVGIVRYFCDGAEIGVQQLYAQNDVALYQKPSLWQRICQRWK